MHRLLSPLLVAVLFVVAPVVAAAADKPVEAFPQDAGLVVRWQKPAETFQKAVDFAAAVDPQYGQQLKQLQPVLGVVVSNPGQLGVDKTGDWWVAVFPSAEAEPGILFAVPAEDSQKMKQAVGGDYQFIEYENWLLYTDSEELAGRVREQVESADESIAGLIDKESAAVMDRGDLSMFVNAPQLWTTYKQDLQNARDEFEAMMGQMQGVAGSTPGMNIAAVFEMYRQVFLAGLQALEDAQSAALGLTVAEDGVLLEKYARVKADSATHKILKKHEVGKLDGFSHLPSGHQFYAGFHGDMKELMQWGIKFALSAYSKPENPDLQKAIEETRKQLEQVEFGNVLLSAGLGDAQNGAIRMAMINEVKPAGKLKEPFRQMTRSIGTIEAGFLKQTTELRPDAEMYGEHAADLVVTRQEVDPQVDPNGMMRQMYQTMYGPDGMVQRIVYLDDKFLQTMGGGREEMEKLLKRLDEQQVTEQPGSEKSHKALAAVRQKLPEQANAIVLLDVPGYFGRMMAVMFQAMPVPAPIPIDVEGLQKLGEKPSYLGMSAAIESTAVRGKLYVPLEQAKSFASMIKIFQNMGAGAAF